MMLVVTRETVEEALRVAEAMGSAIFYLPRPLPAEDVERLARFARGFAMPRSTWERLSRRAKEIIGTPIITSARGRYARMDMETIHRILALRRAGLSIRQIARDVDLPKSTVHYVLRRLRKVGGEIPILLQ